MNDKDEVLARCFKRLSKIFDWEYVSVEEKKQIIKDNLEIAYDWGVNEGLELAKGVINENTK